MLDFEDFRPGDALRSPKYTVDQDEMIEFARRWDPVPIPSIRPSQTQRSAGE